VLGLINACVPASFGRGGENVFDESYRRAGALSAEDFMTDFCPYEAGIIDIVTQLLLPPMSKWRGIRAELYKLNVYNGPSGMFKAHVDTPRSDAQIGSLVVCLPVAFEGGALAVRHQGREIVHEWSHGQGGDPELEANAQCLQWAAFYSDCEHEVMPVTNGSRITLTYNLYLSAGTGLLAGHLRGLQPATLPVLTELKRTLQNDTFMQDGGYLGYYLVHGYPHSNGTLLRLVPNMLKGADLAMYEALRATNLMCVLEPISNAHGKYLGLLDSLEGKECQSTSEPGTPPSSLQGVDVDKAVVEEVDELDGYNSQMEEGSEDYVPPDYDRITWLNTSYGKNRELNMARLAVSDAFHGHTW
ncbi:hypothetical protein EJ03DRAFT_268957, partial [Teratosphaeria nubilosa]